MTTFVDTNVLVHARDETEPDKQARAAAWVEDLWRSGEGRVSFQVLHEYYVTVTGRLSVAVPVAEARADVEDLLTWRPIEVDETVLIRAWEAQDRFGFSFWDALIVAAAQIAGCDRLLTEDLSDGQMLAGLKVVDPFHHDP